MRPSDVFAQQLTAIREQRGLTQQELATVVTKLVEPPGLTRSTVAKVEIGSRKVSIDEMTAFAIALDVSPMALMVPTGWEWRDREPMTWEPAVDHPVEDPWRAVQWFRGVFPLSTDPAVKRNFDAERPEFEQDAEHRFGDLARLLTMVTLALRQATTPGDREAMLNEALDAIEALAPAAASEARRAYRAIKQRQPPLDIDRWLDDPEGE